MSKECRTMWDCHKARNYVAKHYTETDFSRQHQLIWRRILQDPRQETLKGKTLSEYPRKPLSNQPNSSGCTQLYRSEEVWVASLLRRLPTVGRCDSMWLVSITANVRGYWIPRRNIRLQNYYRTQLLLATGERGNKPRQDSLHSKPQATWIHKSVFWPTKRQWGVQSNNGRHYDLRQKATRPYRSVTMSLFSQMRQIDKST